VDAISHAEASAVAHCGRNDAADSALTRALQWLRSWLSGPSLSQACQATPQPSAPVAGGLDDEARWTDVEPLPLCARSILALSDALDRHPHSRSAFGWLAVVEKALATGKRNPLEAVSAQVLRQAVRQLEAFVDLRRHRDLVPLYLHMRRGVQRSVPIIADVVEQTAGSDYPGRPHERGPQ
jgi:hypothetical protein